VHDGRFSGSLHLEYLQRAVQCRRKANAAATPVARAKFLEAESRWLTIADSYAKPEQMGNEEIGAEDSQPMQAAEMSAA
jgi:hypothetical protein